MDSLSSLTAAGLIEKDSHGDLLWTWSYPSVDNTERGILMTKCQLSTEKTNIPYIYGHVKKSWYYIFSTQCQNSSLPKVSAFSLVLLAGDFHPEKYRQLCQILSSLYSKSGNPAKMLESYLSVVTRGSCSSEENGSYNIREFDQRQAYTAGTLKSVINLFGIETIILYTALILKKRVVVYHPNVEELLNITRALPSLVWHRQNWKILYPWVNLEDVELDELNALSCYVAGFTDMTVESRHDLYDVFVNASCAEITVAPHSKDCMAMGKIHKDIATHIISAGEDDNKSDQQVIKEISLKTRELLNNLKSLADQDEYGRTYVKLETLREKKFPKSTETFLFNLAAAEGLLQT